MKWKELKPGDHVWYYNIDEDREPFKKVISKVIAEVNSPDQWVYLEFSDGSTDYVPGESETSEIGCFVNVGSEEELSELIAGYIQEQIYDYLGIVNDLELEKQRWIKME